MQVKSHLPARIMTVARPLLTPKNLVRSRRPPNLSPQELARLHELHAKGALLGLVAMVLTWQTMGIAVGIVIAEHAIHFRARIITEPEVLQHRITNPASAVPPPPGNATAIAAAVAVLIRLITAIGRNPLARRPSMAEPGPGVKTASRRLTLTTTPIGALTIRGEGLRSGSRCQ